MVWYGRDPARALKLNEFRFVIEHIAGEDNVWADMLTRWAVQPRNKVANVKVSKSQALIMAPINMVRGDDLDMPERKEIIMEENKNRLKQPKGLRKEDGVYKFEDGKVWIPEQARELILRIMIGAHTGRAGHRAVTPTLQNITENCRWNGMHDIVAKFVNSCIHC